MTDLAVTAPDASWSEDNDWQKQAWHVLLSGKERESLFEHVRRELVPRLERPEDPDKAHRDWAPDAPPYRREASQSTQPIPVQRSLFDDIDHQQKPLTLALTPGQRARDIRHALQQIRAMVPVPAVPNGLGPAVGSAMCPARCDQS